MTRRSRCERNRIINVWLDTYQHLEILTLLLQPLRRLTGTRGDLCVHPAIFHLPSPWYTTDCKHLDIHREEKTEIKTIISNIRSRRGFRGKKTSLVLRTHLRPFNHEATGTINCHGKVNEVAPKVPSQQETGCETDISKNRLRCKLWSQEKYSAQ